MSALGSDAGARRMRVLHVSSTFPQTEDDPTGWFIAALAAAQRGAGADVAVIAPHSAGRPVEDTIDGVPVRRFRYAPESLEMLTGRGGLLAATRRSAAGLLVPGYVGAMAATTVTVSWRWRPDVIHAHWWLPGGAAAAAAGAATRTPFVLTFHGSDVHLARRRGVDAAARVVVHRARALTAVSEALAAEVTQTFGRDCEVVAMPVAAAAVERATPPVPPLRVVGAGRLAPEKGWDVLVRAIALLGDDKVGVECDLIGDGPERAALESLAAAVRAPARVRLHGARPPGEVREWMAAAHAVVVPSRREGLGLAAVEALAAGTPVIASKTGGLVEVVDEGVDGLLVAPEDPAALAAAIRRLPLPPPRGGRIARHAPERVASEHLALYRRVVGGARV